MFGWLLGKNKKEDGKRNDASGKKAQALHAHAAAQADAGGTARNSLEQASEHAMQQRREQRKADRTGRREALFGVVREVMLRSGILSSAYKFKVLSIDQKGRHFLVLLDLSTDLAYSEPAERLIEIEKMISETAMSRMQVVVQAVYWRYFSSGQAATVRLSSGDTQPGGLTTSINMETGIGASSQAAQPTKKTTPAHESGQNAAEAISSALADLRAKNKAKMEEHALGKSANPAAAQAGVADFAATQVINRAAVSSGAAFAAAADTSFPDTRMQTNSAQADAAELAAFQRALQGGGVASHPQAHDENEDDYPASIFVSGKALDGPRDPYEEMDEHFANGGNGADLSGTQYGELR